MRCQTYEKLIFVLKLLYVMSRVTKATKQIYYIVKLKDVYFSDIVFLIFKKISCYLFITKRGPI